MKRIGKTLFSYSAVSLLTLLGTSSSFAAYDKTVNWADMTALDLKRVFKSNYGSNTNLFEPMISPSAHELALRDADKRIGSEFQVPEAMRAAVSFWMRVYTEYTTQHLVIFDEKHPDIIYEVLDFRELYKKSRNRIAYEIVSKARAKAKMRAYRDALARLRRNPKPKRPTEIEKTILAAHARLANHKHGFYDMARNLRSQTGQRDNVVKGLLAAETFFPKMESIFKEVGIPPELTRLALVESSFNLSAISKVGASGVWQFMYKSGLEYMTIDPRHSVDERLSPLKSTVAAARLLKRNYKTLGTWPLAITAYNHGVRGLLRFSPQDRKNSNDGKIFDGCRKGQRLGFASRSYYAEFLALLHAETYRELFYGNSPLPIAPPVAFHRMTKPKSGLKLSLEHGVSLREFQFFNPDVRNLQKPLPAGFYVALPGHKDDMSAMIDTIAPTASRLRRVREVSLAQPR